MKRRIEALGIASALLLTAFPVAAQEPLQIRISTVAPKPN